MNRRIDIYVDLVFIRKYFDALNKSDTLSEEFEVYFSFLKILKQSHIRIVNLESGRMLRSDDIVRVFQSTFRPRQIDSRHREISYSEVRNPQSIFLGEGFTDNCNVLSSKFGFLFSNFEAFFAHWKKLLLINTKKTVHIQRESDSSAARLFWKRILREYQVPANSVLFVDPYLNSWFRPGTESRVYDNFLEIVSTLLSGGKKELLVITNSGEYRSRRLEGELINPATRNMSKLSANLRTYHHKIFSFHKETLRANLNSDDTMPYDLLSNILHDRYIVTNYFLIISTHSMDIVNEDGEIRKNTQLIIEPLLSQDFFDFYCSKMRSYQELLRWERDDRLMAYVLTEPPKEVTNSHIDYTESIEVSIGAGE